MYVETVNWTNNILHVRSAPRDGLVAAFILCHELRLEMRTQGWNDDTHGSHFSRFDIDDVDYVEQSSLRDTAVTAYELFT
jgi:hypothetical protein